MRKLNFHVKIHDVIEKFVHDHENFHSSCFLSSCLSGVIDGNPVEALMAPRIDTGEFWVKVIQPSFIVCIAI